MQIGSPKHAFFGEELTTAKYSPWRFASERVDPETGFIYFGRRSCRHQRCWVHKTANVLDKISKSIQGNAKRRIHEMYIAPTKEKGLKREFYCSL